MTAADIRPDYDPSRPNGALVGAMVAIVLTLGAAVAGVVTVLIFVMDGTR